MSTPKVYMHQKDVSFGRIGFNAAWVRSHATEEDFVAKCGALNLLDENKAKELYALTFTEDPSKVIPVRNRRN